MKIDQVEDEGLSFVYIQPFKSVKTSIYKLARNHFKDGHIMGTIADKTSKNKSQALENDFTENQSRSNTIFQFEDNRPKAVAQREIQEMANNSPRVQRTAQLQAIANQGTPLQLKKKKLNVEYAESSGEAKSLMIAYAKKIDMDFNKLEQRLQELCIEIAQDYERGGIDGGERLIFSKKQEIRDAELKEERVQRTKEDFEEIEGGLQGGNEIVLNAFRIAHSMYVGGGGTNGTLSKSYSSHEYFAAKREWEFLQDTGVITNFHAFKPQDKAAVGKGNVGATLATRKVQGNLLCKFNGVTINIHVDIE